MTCQVHNRPTADAGRAREPVIDAHLHSWRPSAASKGVVQDGDLPFSVDDAIAWMDADGVRTALQFERVFEPDDQHSIEGAARWPSRIRVVGRPPSTCFSEPDGLGAWIERTGVAGIRVWAKVFPVAVLRRADHPFWAAASESGLPLTVYRPEQLQEIGEVAAMNPGLTLVIDHAAALLDGDPRVAFSVAPALAGLSRHPNVVIKASGLPQATGEAFPFVLAQRRLLEVVEQFGAERVMWGSNFTGSRGVEGYSELVEYARDAVSGLSDADRHAVLCGTAARVFGLPSP